VSQLNGYFGNDVIKILLPDKVRQAAELLGKLGYQKQMDEFIQSMNRAAEKAAPKAASHFADAIQGMSIEDARKILAGNNRAATDYFQSKTSAQLYDAFKPTISESMGQVGVTRSYSVSSRGSRPRSGDRPSRRGILDQEPAPPKSALSGARISDSVTPG
jgi:hypothetical protein